MSSLSTTFYGELATLDTALTAAVADILATESDISGLDARMASAESDIDTTSASLATLSTSVTSVTSAATSLDTRLGAAELDIAALESAPGAELDPTLEALLTYLAVDDASDTITFSGANLFVNNGAGATATNNGFGNLVVGYAESSGDTRTGSHNLVVGPLHSWSSYGGLLAGYDNVVAAPYATVSGGQRLRLRAVLIPESGCSSSRPRWPGGGALPSELPRVTHGHRGPIIPGPG
ncbi:MAG: hypothetical protein Q8P18_19945 [Pseudomonadota bacterium]|nr:hypothetical protein [Pseudomonadota bacterium]